MIYDDDIRSIYCFRAGVIYKGYWTNTERALITVITIIIISHTGITPDVYPVLFQCSAYVYAAVPTLKNTC